MITFNNYPPQDIGDIEFTPSALAHLKSLGRSLSSDYLSKAQEETLSTTVIAYGESIGRVIVASLEPPRRRTAVALMEPLYAELSEHPALLDMLRQGEMRGRGKELPRQQEQYRAKLAEQEVG